MADRYIKLSDVVEVLRAESRRRQENEDQGRGYYGEGGASMHAAAAAFLADSGLGVEGVEGWLWRTYSAPDGSVVIYDVATIRQHDNQRPAVVVLLPYASHEQQGS